MNLLPSGAIITGILNFDVLIFPVNIDLEEACKGGFSSAFKSFLNCLLDKTIADKRVSELDWLTTERSVNE